MPRLLPHERYLCTKCAQEFSEYAESYAHARSHHRSDKPYEDALVMKAFGELDAQIAKEFKRDLTKTATERERAKVISETERERTKVAEAKREIAEWERQHIK